MLFDFPSGFPLSLNGAPDAPSGPLTFRVLVDSASPDLNPGADRGRFTPDAVTLTAPQLGYLHEPMVAPTPLYIDTFFGGFTIIGFNFNPDIGWNLGPAPSDLMADLNDLGTFVSLPVNVTTSGTFFIRPIGLANGDTLVGSTGGLGPDGRFSVRLVPEPAALTLAAIGLMASRRRRC